MADSEEKELIAKARRRDKTAFNALIGRYQALVTKTAFNLLPDHLKKDTAEVVQETFLKAWSALKDFEERRPGGFGKWLSIIATNTALDKVRKFPREHAGSDSLEYQLLADGMRSHLAQDDLAPRLKAVGPILASMDWDCRIFLIAGFAYNISPAEIARIARASLTPSKDEKEQTTPVYTWFQKLFAPLEQEMKGRRDYCWKKFKQKLSGDEPPDSKSGTKKESRKSQQKPGALTDE